jgi:very-short-patch-repair endonuclease
MNMPYKPYQQPPPSPIEVSFWEAASPRIPELQREVWIDRKYRVDFLVPSKKIVIELYGYEYHKDKRKLTKDAQRERSLQMKGYQVLRFTGSEVYNDVTQCVNEVLAIINSRPDHGAAPSSKSPQVQAKALPPMFGMEIWQVAVLGGMLLAIIATLVVLAVLILGSGGI